MKTKWTSFVKGLVFLCLTQPAMGQHGYKDKTHISRSFSVDKNNPSAAFAIYNINGWVKVEGYAGDKVLIDVDQTITAEEAADFEQGKKEVKLEFEQLGDSIVAYMISPYDSRPHRNKYNDDRHIHYQHRTDYTIKVPLQMNLDISTVNGWEVLVRSVSGKQLRVHDVNGNINLINVKGTTDVSTVNGSITVNYASNPSAASSYHTINGDIKVHYQPGFSGDLQLKSMRGEFYTDFESVALPVNVIRNKESQGNGTVYKLNKRSAIRIGSGGTLFKFETLNGNVYIKKQS